MNGLKIIKEIATDEKYTTAHSTITESSQRQHILHVHGVCLVA